MLEQLTRVMQEKMAQASQGEETFKFVLKEGGVIFLDFSTKQVSNEDKDAECTIYLKEATLQNLLEGKSNPMTAFMLGKIKVEGNLASAMKLTQFL